MNDLQRLRQLVMSHQTVRQAANHNHVGLQASAESIDDFAYFATDSFNGRVLPQQKWTQPKPLPPVVVFKHFQKR
ncbi:hypothetical protein [Edaphobacter aggregans]|uniref:hypothetical protein n=1 Tax=Edaphobacter aggregans TaxID=570835 RepID=UPI0005528BEE|nr:hypothetical protein [Edaphobacter aggregans]